MILVDANILMYAAGASHRSKKPSIALLERIAAGTIEGVIDAEVLQEILHRYRAIHEWETGRRVYDLARRLFQVIVPITAEIVDDARALLDADGRLMARDALHAAVCLHIGAEALCSYDKDFDRIAGLKRVEPKDLL